MTQTATAKKDTQRLQRAIVDGLEDVKGQDIQVFNTEHLSPLFERVIVASGTSNRQTRALASSVIESVRDAGFPKPRIEGEENGEWIIVDCGPAVAHIMQPAIRQYYHLEEIWGDKPVRLRLGAPKPPPPPAPPAAKKAVAAGTSLRRSSAAKTAAKDAQRESATGSKQPSRAGAKSAAVKAAAQKAPARRPAAKGGAARGGAARGGAAKGGAAKAGPTKAGPTKAGAAKKAAARRPAAGKAAPRQR